MGELAPVSSAHVVGVLLRIISFESMTFLALGSGSDSDSSVVEVAKVEVMSDSDSDSYATAWPYLFLFYVPFLPLGIDRLPSCLLS